MVGRAASGSRCARNKSSGSASRQDYASNPGNNMPPGLAERFDVRPLYGALDLGTNNCRLLIAGPAPQGLRVIDAFSRIVRLGEGLSRNGMMSEAAIVRTIKAIRVCANKLTWWQVDRARLIATEACRMAGNGAAFIERVAEETGVELEIIDRETEAQLAVAGASPLIDKQASNVVVFDIGGGSTEIMWLVMDDTGAYKISNWTSLPAGVVTLAEEFGGRDVTPESFAAMRAKLRPALLEFSKNIKCHKPLDHLLGTSGTVTTIAGIHMGLSRYDRSKVDGYWIDAKAAGHVTAELLAMDYHQRAASPCIGHERADLVMAGCAIFEEIRSFFPAPRIRVADRGLREGILTSFMREDGFYGQAR